MKIALLLKGSSINRYKHWQFGDEISVDYRNNIENLKSKLIVPNSCDVFFHTWKSDGVDEDRYHALAKELSATDYIVDEDIPGDHGPNLGKKVITTTGRVIECYENYVKKTGNSYDLVVVCRFDLYFLHEVRLKILEHWKLANTVFVYSIGHNREVSILDKKATATAGIDDNFIVFTPDAIPHYRKALGMKKPTIATYRDDAFFNPTQHPSLHHLYYFLPTDTILKNLVDIFPYTNGKCLHGTIKKMKKYNMIISRTPPNSYTDLGEGLYVIHYS